MSSRAWLVALGLLVLAGCATGDPGASPSPSPSPSVSASPTPRVTAAPTPSPSARVTATPSARVTATPTAKSTATPRPSPSPSPTAARTPLPGQKLVGDAATGTLFVPLEWEDCGGAGTLRYCLANLGYEVSVETGPAGEASAQDAADALESGFAADASCAEVERTSLTVRGTAVEQLTTACGGNDIWVNVVDAPDSARVFRFQGPGGVAFDAYYQPIWQSYQW
ncbi:MAG: hypothetical protein LBR33_09265 [Propionibacteriaceae bacterium]|jgi:hypothetical protein|nr:hypothetical protein [Propionibacteriaceae bacterium]